MEDLWQLHASKNPDADNSPDAFVANVDDGQTGYWIRLTASDDGSFHDTQWPERIPAKVYKAFR